MPFRESCPVEERIALLRDYESGAFSVVELCARCAERATAWCCSMSAMIRRRSNLLFPMRLTSQIDSTITWRNSGERVTTAAGGCASPSLRPMPLVSNGGAWT